jgi:excisionase family DNA binding protein
VSAGGRTWFNSTQAGKYINRSKRFVLREIHAGKLRAARIGGRGEILTTPEWLDQYVESQASPVIVPVRRRA